MTAREKVAPHLLRYLENLPAGQAFSVTIEPYTPSRTHPQNNLYWKWMGELAEHTGYTPDELHTHCKQQFLPQRIITIQGKQYQVAESTTRLNKQEFSDYMLRIEKLAAEMGMALTQPAEIQ